LPLLHLAAAASAASQQPPPPRRPSLSSSLRRWGRGGARPALQSAASRRSREQIMDRSDYERAQLILQRLAPVEYLKHLKSLEAELAAPETHRRPRPIEITDASRPAAVAAAIRGQLLHRGSGGGRKERGARDVKGESGGAAGPVGEDGEGQAKAPDAPEPPRAILHARGMAAINQAVKAIAVARRNWIEERAAVLASKAAYTPTLLLDPEARPREEEGQEGRKGEEEKAPAAAAEAGGGRLGSDLCAFVHMHPREELTWACTLEVVPFSPEPEPTLQLGEIVEYNSSTHGVWIPGEVIHINEDGTVDLNIREEADPARIRRLMEEIRVARTSEPDLVGKTIAAKMKLGQSIMLAAIGPSSVHASVLGIALGSLYMQEDDEAAQISFRPEFTTIELGSATGSKLVTLRIILDAGGGGKKTQSPHHHNQNRRPMPSWLTSSSPSSSSRTEKRKGDGN